MEMWRVSLAWGQVNSQTKRFTWGNGGRRKLCVVPYQSFYNHVAWRSKEVGSGEVLKPSGG